MYCAPVNQCVKPYGPKCDENADCFMIAPNSSRCVCKEFFEGDGKSCSQVDACAKGMLFRQLICNVLFNSVLVTDEYP